MRGIVCRLKLINERLSMRSKIILLLSVCAWAVMASAAIVGYPPAHAQGMTYTQPVITAKDAVQDQRLDQLKEFRDQQQGFNTAQNEHNDKRFKDLEDEQSKVSSNLAGIETELRVVFSVFGAIQGVVITVIATRIGKKLLT